VESQACVLKSAIRTHCRTLAASFYRYLLCNDLATLRRIIHERIWGVTYVVRHAAPKMSQGSITFTSGGLSSRPRLGTAMLTTALAGVEAMTPALALELAQVMLILMKKIMGPCFEHDVDGFGEQLSVRIFDPRVRLDVEGHSVAGPAVSTKPHLDPPSSQVIQ
jgi:hypothetical protein